MDAGKRTTEEPFVVFGPAEARKARKAVGLPEPPVVAEAPPDAGFLRRLWAYFSAGDGEGRKLWGSIGLRRDGS